ncbi:hypothetical protein NQZ79_g1230 [Umbelopsis isabellina]|nr:hypothetical protein NQZ79_g1230 [Umbelopsis isabellina]
MHKHKIPPELLSLILENLEDQNDLFTCTTVNRTFNAAATIVLWREPALNSASVFYRFAASLARTKESKGKLVRVLDLHRSVNSLVTDDWLSDIIIWTPLLDTLCIPMCDQISDKSMVKLAKYCPELTYLDVSRSRITYRTCHHLRFCQKLRYLSLGATRDLNEFALLPFGNSRIDCLRLNDCPWVSVAQTAQDICALHHLEDLDMINCRDVDDEFLLKLSIPDTDMKSFNPLPELVTFALSSSRSITDEGVMAFVRAHPKLESLTIYQSSITDRTINEIRVSLPNLSFLDLSYCDNITSRAVRRLIADNDKLEMIGLKGCLKVRSFDFVELGNSDYHPGIDRLTSTEMDIIRTSELNRLNKAQQLESSIHDGQ